MVRFLKQFLKNTSKTSRKQFLKRIQKLEVLIDVQFYQGCIGYEKTYFIIVKYFVCEMFVRWKNR